MKLNAHARIEIALVTAMLLGSCSASPKYSASEAYDLADVARANSVNALNATAELESRLEALEGTVKVNERNIETAFSNAEADRNTANENALIINRALNRLDRVEQRLGM